MKTLARIGTTLALILGLASSASADSFLTSVSTKSKTAARVAPEPYTGSTIQAKNVVPRALQTIKSTRNAAIGLDVIQRVDGQAMDNPKLAGSFGRGLAKLSRSGDPVYTVLRGANLARRNPDSDRAAAMVRKAARQAPNDSAVQLVAGLALAQREAFGKDGGAQWETATKGKREAAKLINKAQELEAKTIHPRPLVREGIKEAKEYAGYYAGYNGLIK